MLYTLTKNLGQACIKYYEYFDILFKQMLQKTTQYDFKTVLFLFEAIGVVAFYTATGDENSKNLL